MAKKAKKAKKAKAKKAKKAAKKKYIRFFFLPGWSFPSARASGRRSEF